MKTSALVSFCVVALHFAACEVAELPPLHEVRDTRDTAEVVPDVAPDTALADTSVDDATPDTTSDTAIDPDIASDTAIDPDTATDTSVDPDTALDPDTATDTLVDPDTMTDTSVEPDTTADTTSDTTSDTTTPSDTTSSCMPLTATHAVVPSPHVATCSEVTYETDPPTSGPHYPVWAAFKTYGLAINPGFLVHALEHGAIVITWRCPTGCDTELAALQAMLDARVADPLCDPLVKHRIIVAPRPDQSMTLMAAGWGASWKADCFDLNSLGSFIDAWYAKGPENFCAQGVDIGTILPDNAWFCPP